jgi:hypothetical protein
MNTGSRPFFEGWQKDSVKIKYVCAAFQPPLLPYISYEEVLKCDLQYISQNFNNTDIFPYRMLCNTVEAA